MKILVTGATGFLGRVIVGKLVGQHEVVALVRATSSRERFAPELSFAEGDVTDRASLERAMGGCDAVIHAAALVKILAPREDFDRINVQGLENVLAAASSAGVEKLVYVSSFMALGPTEGGKDRQLDEQASVADRRWINDYERTKTLADRAARRAIESGAALNVVYPGVIYGPGELTEGNIIVRLILDIVNQRLPGWIGTADLLWNYVFVEDVAEGIVRTLERASAGARYVLGGENLRHEQFYAAIGRATGAAPPKFRIPFPLATSTGAMMRAWARLTGGVPKLTPDLVEVNRHDWALTSKKAEAELGYTWRTFDQGLAETVTWLRATGQWPPP
jgi:nucleoside-diphosphate-sugar epimerase